MSPIYQRRVRNSIVGSQTSMMGGGRPRSSASAPRPSSAILDRFDIADGALEANWATLSLIGTALRVRERQAESGAAFSGSYYNRVFTADQEIFQTMTAIGSEITQFIRLVSPERSEVTTGYDIFWDEGRVTLFSIVPPMRFTAIGAVGRATLHNGDRLWVRAIRETIAAYQALAATPEAFTLVESWTDTRYKEQAGVIAMRMAPARRIDDFGGGSI